MKMRFQIICIGILLSSACHPTANNLGIQLKLEKYLLANGLTVVVAEDHRFPVISYQTWYRVGSVDEYPGVTGISHMFEHLMFNGTAAYGPKQFFQELESQGAEASAYTTRDYTVFYETFTNDLASKVIEMESDRMQNLVLNDQILAVEKIVVQEERRLKMDSPPETKMQEILWQLAYRGHSYQWPVIGYPSDLPLITTQQMVQYFQKYFQPSNAAIVVVGDFQATELLSKIKKSYEKIPSQAKPIRDVLEEPEQKEERRLLIRDRVISERFIRGYHITSAESPDSYALDVLANILFEGTSSRAYQRLIEEKNLLIALSGSSYTPTFPGLFIISGTLKGKISAALAEDELDSVIEELQEKGVTDQEVHVAVRQLGVQFADSIRTAYGLGQMIGTVQTIFGEPQRFIEDLSKYMTVKPEDVRRVAVQYLQPNNRSVVNLVPDQSSKGVW